MGNLLIQDLHDLGILYHWGFPLILHITYNSKTSVVRSDQDARKFLKILQAEARAAQKLARKSIQ